MTVIRLASTNDLKGLRIADDAQSLRSFLEPGCAAAIWRRKTPSDIQTWLDELDPSHWPSGRVVLPKAALEGTLQHLCDISGLSQGQERDWLVGDLLDIATTVAELIGVDHLRLRLDRVTTNACRKFHVDAMSSRLVCTYRGTGTQYGTAARGEDPGRIFTVDTGSPVLLRGSLWPALPPSGLVHRSPPIEGTGETRFVAVIDPIADPELGR